MANIKPKTIVITVAVALFICLAGFIIFNRVKEKTGLGVRVDTNNPEQFIQSDFIDLSKIYSISKFRSAEGHDFSGGGETCRSMKHYFEPQVDPTVQMQKASDGRSIPPQPDGVHDIDIFSPVDGVITDITTERLPVGEQIYIRPTNAKDYTVRLFHIYKLDGITKGSQVKAGQKIGVISGYSTTDISVEAGRGDYISYFQVMPDSIFANYQKRGASSKDDFIISRQYRDANPVPCNQDKQGDQSFQYPNGYDHEADKFRLSGYIKPDYEQMKKGYHNCNNFCGSN